jgi:hypothetical protein
MVVVVDEVVVELGVVVVVVMVVVVVVVAVTVVVGAVAVVVGAAVTGGAEVTVSTDGGGDAEAQAATKTHRTTERRTELRLPGVAV